LGDLEHAVVRSNAIGTDADPAEEIAVMIVSCPYCSMVLGVLPMPDVEIRELPDSARVFEVSEPNLSWIRVDDQTRLQFGETELVIEGPFRLLVGATEIPLDPTDRGALGPLLGLYPDSLMRLTMARDGTLEATFASGAVISVPPSPRFEAWSIGGFSGPPSGFVMS
jgi:hypothetical protein